MRWGLLFAMLVPAVALAQDYDDSPTVDVFRPQSAPKKKKPVAKQVRRRNPHPVVPDSIAPPVMRRKKPVPVEAVEEAPESYPEAPAVEVEAGNTQPETAASELDYQGHVRLRGTRAFVDRHALLAGVTTDLSDYLLTLEANLQPRVKLLDGRLTAAADVSILTGTSSPYFSVAMSELYVQATLGGSVFLLAGRRRVVWGTGLSWNPTDLINPPRDLLEPARTRAGALMLPMVDIALDQVTLSAFVNAPVTYDAYGLPRAVAIDKPIVGTRAFTNQMGADLSLMYFYDRGKNRHSVGAAMSSVIGDIYEIHAEGIVHMGSPDRPPMSAVDACGPGLGPMPTSGGSAVIGARRDWSDRSLIAVEYLFNSGGYTPDEYRLVRTELPCLRAAAKVAALSDPTRPTAITSPVVLVRQHYMSVLAQKPHLADEGWLEHIGVSGGAIVSLSDGSTIIQARVDYTVEALAVSLVGAAFLGPGGGEVTLAPTRGLLTVELRYSF